MQYLLTKEEYEEITGQEKSSRLEELEKENKKLKRDLNILVSPSSIRMSLSPSRPLSKILEIGFELEDLSEHLQKRFERLLEKGRR